MFGQRLISRSCVEWLQLQSSMKLSSLSLRLTMNRTIPHTLSLAMLATGSLLAAMPCHADEFAYSCSFKQQAHVTVTQKDGACIGFDWKPDKMTSTHVDFDMPVSGTVLISNDGHRVVAIQNFFYGGENKDASLFAYGGAKASPDPVAVSICRDGAPIAAYRFSEILLRPRMVSLSVSHVQWVRGTGEFESSGGRKLLLTTTSMRELMFDLQSGKILSQNNTSEWNNCDVIAYGPVTRVGARSQMLSAHFAKGEVSKSIGFTVAPQLDIRDDGQYETMCLKKVSSGLQAVAVIPLMLNALTLEQ